MSQSLLTAEIAQGSLQIPDDVVLTDDQATALRECIDWYNAQLGTTADNHLKHAFSELVLKDGFHRVKLGGFYFNVINWCVIYEDFKRRRGMDYHDPYRRDLS